jgi:hypothetical protein
VVREIRAEGKIHKPLQKMSTAAEFGAGLREYLGKLNIPTSTTCSAEVGYTKHRQMPMLRK